MRWISKAKSWRLALLATALLAATVGCEDDPQVQTAERAVVALRVTPEQAVLEIGATQQFTAVQIWSDGAVAPAPAADVTWTTNAAAIAAVSETGLATAKAAGSAELTAKVGDRTAKATLKVNPAPVVPLPKVVAVHVTPTYATLAVGEKRAFAATAAWDDGSTADVTSKAAWTSENLSVVRIDSTGTAVAVKGGHATIVAAFSGRTDSAAIYVQQKTLIHLQMIPSSATVAVGSVLQLNAKAVYDDGSTSDATPQAQWHSSAPATASVDGNGKVTGNAAGTAVITAALGNNETTAFLQIKAKQLQTIQVTPLLATVAIGDSQAFVATANYDDGSAEVISAEAVWSSSDPAAVAVDTIGIAKGMVGGKAALVSASYLGKVGSATLSVAPAAVEVVALTPPLVTLAKGQKQQLMAMATLTDGQLIDVTSQIQWSSAYENVAVVDKKGVVTGLTPGQTVLTGTFGLKSGTALITVTDAVVTAVQVMPPVASSFVGGPSMQFTAQAIYSDGTTGPVTQEALWASSNPQMASVNASGSATALANGTATITATYQGIPSSAATLFIAPAVVSTIEIQPAKATIAKGTTLELVAMATLSDNSKVNLSSSVVWQTSDPSVATVGPNGVAAGLAPGAATITAVYQGKFAAMTLTVSGASLLSVDIAPAYSLPMPVKSTRQFQAIGTFSDNTTQDITEQVAWSTSNGSVATVSNAPGSRGLLTAMGKGTASLSATLGKLASLAVPIAVDSDVQLASISLWPSSLLMVEGQAATLVATGHYSDGGSFDVTTSAVWDVVDAASTPNADHAVVAKGQVTALQSTAAAANGKVLVRVRLGAVAALAPLVIKATDITAISVTCEGPLTCLPAGIGYPVRCAATASYGDGTTGDITATATWSSSATQVASSPKIINGQAVSTIVGSGTAVLTASQGGVTSSAAAPSAALVGANLKLDAIAVTPPTSTLAKGFTLQMKAAGQFSGSGPCAGLQVRDITQLGTWSSSIGSVANVGNAAGAKGMVTAVAPGTTSIGVVLGQISRAAQVTVSQACLQKVQIAQPNAKWPSQILVPLKVFAYYSDAPDTPVPIQPGSSGSWSSGLVHPQTWYLSVGTAAPGALTYSVVAGACTAAVSDTTTISLDTAATLAALAIVPTAGQIAKGGYQDFSAVATYNGYGPLHVSSYASWSNLPALGLSHGTAPNGRDMRLQHQGTQAGTTTVAVAYKNLTATAALQVSGATLQSVQILGTDPPVPPQLGVPVGLDLRFQVRVHWSDGTFVDNPTGVQWSSSDPGQLAFAEPGRAWTLSSSGAGAPQVKAAFGGMASAPMAIAISTAVLVDLKFSPASGLVLPRNSKAPLTVTGLYSDGTAFGVSHLVSAASGNANLVQVQVDASGVLVSSLNTTTTAPVQLTFQRDAVSRTFLVGVSGSCLNGVSVLPSKVGLSMGQTMDFYALASDTGGGLTTVSQAGSWSATAGLMANLGAVPGSANRFQATGLGSAEVAFQLTGDHVCAGGDLTKHTLVGQAAVTVSSASMESLAILPQPIAPAAARRVPVGEAVQLLALAAMSDGTQKNVTAGVGTQWNSQNPLVATVTAGGVLLAQGPGQTTVSALTTNGKKADLLVEVLPCGAPVVQITTAGLGKLPVGASRQFAATAKYAATAVCTAEQSEREFVVTQAAQFYSTDPAKVVIASGGAEAGLAKAVAAGPAAVWANYHGAWSPSHELMAVAVALKSLQISAPTSTYKNGQISVAVSAIYTDGQTNFSGLPAPALAWNVLDPTVAAVSSGNVLSGLKMGATEYFAQVGPVLSNTLPIAVSGACIKTVALTEPLTDATLPRGVPFELAASCATSDGSQLPCVPQYSVADPDNLLDLGPTYGQTGRGRVALGAPTGKAATLKVAVTGQNGACPGELVADSAQLTVGTAVLDELLLGPTAQSVPRGMVALFQVKGSYAAGSGASVYDLTSVASLASNNPLMAKPLGDSAGSVLAGKIDGKALISAQYQGVSSKFASLTVSGKEPVQLSIVAGPNLVGNPGGTATYPVGGFKLQFTAMLRYSDDSHGNANPSVIWTLQPPVLANTSINAYGLFSTGTAVGDQVVVASMDTLSAKFTVHQVGGTVASITLVTDEGAPAVVSVPKGYSQPYQAQFKLTNSAVPGPYWAGGNLTWAISDPAVASLEITGYFKDVAILHGLTYGTANLTAALGASSSGPLTITVSNATLAGLMCEPGETTVAAGGLIQLRAMAKMTDGTVNDVSASANWGNLSAPILSIDGVGLATALSMGEAQVRPKFGGTLSATACTVKVVAP